jgi:hypothetical protein
VGSESDGIDTGGPPTGRGSEAALDWVGLFLAWSAGEEDDKALRIKHDVTSAVVWEADPVLGVVAPPCCMCVPAPLEMANSETSQEQVLGGLPWPEARHGFPVPSSTHQTITMTSRRRPGLRL